MPLSSFVLADSARCRFAVVLHDGFPMFVTQVFCCDYRGPSRRFFICTAVKWAEHS